MRPQDCITNSNGCVDCPPLPATPGQSSRIDAVVGWNSGANSDTVLDGNFHTVYWVGATTAGIVLGFKSARDNQTDPTQVEHGFLIQSAGGQLIASLLEQGAAVGPSPTGVATATAFEVRRQAGIVTYWITPPGGARFLFYTSGRFSAGPKIVNACLYATGDEVI